MENNFKNMKMRNRNLSKYASKDNDAIRLNPNKEDFRTAYFRDIDRILYSLSYTRYIDKTQVFSFEHNDMISKRMTHIQLVSKIARTIGRGLGLNEDLIEAASLGHDLGHVPFGHEGEKILNKLSLEYGEGYFNHNVQSVRTLMEIENNGKGNNITVQVLDAILCHNGEELKIKYIPQKKTKEQFLNEYNKSYKDNKTLKNLCSMTLEGCVVRISDVIAYIGKDIEDAIRLNKIKISDLPSNIIKTLGSTNSEIVNTIVVDIIENSLEKNYITMSEKIYITIQELIDFNYKNIYLKANSKEQLNKLNQMFTSLFNLYYNQIKNNEINEDVYTIFLNNMSSEYLNNTTFARKVIDYIAGMTDNFFIEQYKKYFLI
ncbi:MAG: HD domain-containing protein [Firmicutes bacterium]|nr:HD domain-containing protein [Bacillota bacterium]